MICSAGIIPFYRVTWFYDIASQIKYRDLSNPLMANFLILYPMKTPENQRYIKIETWGALARNALWAMRCPIIKKKAWGMKCLRPFFNFERYQVNSLNRQNSLISSSSAMDWLMSTCGHVDLYCSYVVFSNLTWFQHNDLTRGPEIINCSNLWASYSNLAITALPIEQATYSHDHMILWWCRHLWQCK